MLAAILPAKFVQVDSRAARLWCLVRSLDNPLNGGAGNGNLLVDLAELATRLKRAVRSVYRYLKAAQSAGFIHRYNVVGTTVRIYYCSLSRIARHLQLDSLGPIGEFDLDDLHQAKAKAAEIQAESLQNQSDHQSKKQHKHLAKWAKPAFQLLRSSEKATGVLCRGRRLIYLSRDWCPFGGSQEAIAANLGVSRRTIQNRFSDSWRKERGLTPLNKAQAAYQIAAGDKEFRAAALKYGEGNLVTMGRSVFRCHTNLYDCDVALRSHRFRKAKYKLSLSLETRVAAGLEGGGCISFSDREFGEIAGVAPSDRAYKRKNCQ